jgi:DNA gyrase subunit A
MASDRERIVPVNIEEEMRSSYLDYSMSVIISRALPDVRDGLKPVHRRVMTSMNDLNLTRNRPYRKSAKVTGDVNGNYHPHGTTAIYDTIVRMAQGFSLRYPLVDGQGNFGSVDGDPAAAERYTEVRMTAFAEEMLVDLDKETVEYGPNYDESRMMPLVLPSKVPNLLVNGAAGIAVGMATNVPPHNIGEICDGAVALLENPQLPELELFRLVKGPDFPTAGMILGRAGIEEAYRTGRGRVIVRARTHIEEVKGGREAIVITEIPYQVNKASLIERIADLVKDGTIEDIADIRDESDRRGMRVLIVLKREADSRVTENLLFKHTQMQVTFGIIMLALVDSRPEILTLRQLIQHWLDHREVVVVRRTQFDLRKAEERAHILEGLRIALDHIDEIITLIRGSETVDIARDGLVARFGMTEKQAQAILDMRLQRLTGLERQKIEDEYQELTRRIAELKGILADRARVLTVIKEEIVEIKEKYDDARRTEILERGPVTFGVEDLIADEDMVITVSHAGYIKRLALDSYRKQKRGGRGLTGIKVRDEDFVQHLFVASTHSFIMFFTDRGKCYTIKVHEIPVGSRFARGKSIANLLRLANGERINSLLPVAEFTDDRYLVTATRRGKIKKTVLSQFVHAGRNGIYAMKLAGGDTLIGTDITDGEKQIVLAKKHGLACRFHESQVRSMGRATAGVVGTLLQDDDEVVGMAVVDMGTILLSVTENGYGKRSAIEDYRLTSRGKKGVINIKTTERNGRVVAILDVKDNDQLMMITKNGMIIRCPVDQIRVTGRATQGVKLIGLDEGDRVVGVAHLAVEDEDK